MIKFLNFFEWAYWIVFVGALVADMVLPPPTTYPIIWVVIGTAIGCGINILKQYLEFKKKYKEEEE